MKKVSSLFFLRFLTHHLKYFYEDSMCCNSTSDEIEKWSFLLSKKCEKINFEKAAFRLKRSEKGNFYARYFSNTFISLHYRISILDHTFVQPFGHYWIFQFDHWFANCILVFSGKKEGILLEIDQWTKNEMFVFRHSVLFKQMPNLLKLISSILAYS